MKRALSLLVVVAAAACAPAPPVITISAAAAPTSAEATPPARPRRPAVPIDLALPAPTSEPSPVSVKAPVPAAPAPTPDVVRDLRRTGANVPGLAMAVQGYVHLLSLWPASPNRPRWLSEAAEIYAEIERIAMRAPAHANLAASSRRAAIYYYELLLNDYPKWCAAPDVADPAKSTGCADETLYHLALEQEHDGDVTSARANYSLVIRDWPASRFVPSAHLALGELFFEESSNDPSKLALAEQAYLKALKYPPPDNVVFGYAQLQLGYVLLRKGDRPKAANAFQAAIAWAGAYPSAVGAGPTAAEAKEALARLGVR